MDSNVEEDRVESINHEIYFYSQVNRNSIYDFVILLKNEEEYQIIKALKYDRLPDPVRIHINSEGGYIYEAFAAVDNILKCKVPTVSIIEGRASSAASLMAIVCSKRFIHRYSKVLIHQLSNGLSGNHKQLNDQISNLDLDMKQMKDIYMKYTSIKPKELKKLIANDLMLDSSKCVKLGVVDGVL